MAGLDVLLGGRKRPTIIGGNMLGLGFPALDPSQGGGVPVDPASMSALRSYRASNITGVADGGAIASWPDASAANDPAVQATSGLRPTLSLTAANGKPAVILSQSVSQRLEFTQVATVRTVVAVLKLPTPFVNYGGIIGSASTYDFSGAAYPGLGSGAMFTRDSGSGSVVRDGTARMNGIQLKSGWQAVKPTSWAIVVIRTSANAGAGNLANDRGTFRSNCQYAEMHLFDRVLTDAEVASAEAYLSSRYGITLNQRPSAQTLVNTVYDCDSLTFGQGSTANKNYPAQLATLIAAGPDALINRNMAISGSYIQTVANGRYVSAVRPEYNPAVKNNIYVPWGGINDMYLGGRTPAQVYGDLKTVWQMARNDGFKVIAITTLPALADATFESNRQSLSSMIRSDPSLYDGLADVALDSRIGLPGCQNDTTYFNADKTHMTDAGYGVVASLVKTPFDSLVTA